MNFNRLNLILAGVLSGFCLVLLVTACNNSDKSGNSSTSKTKNDSTSTTANPTSTPVSTTDTSTMGTRTNAVKRVAKVTITPPTMDKSAAMKTDDKGYYNYTETAPAFRGGQNSLENYITNNIEYPSDAMDNNAEGTVYVMFTIDENGKVGNAKTTGTKIGYGLEEEAIKVVNGMTNWTPGMNKGKKVKGWYTLPITYKLEE
ncbi:MAG: energy transducer TonB [Chitinophagaceae bacterium]|nr:energy transducer TonB [Chitinophagaceae bacterium]